MFAFKLKVNIFNYYIKIVFGIKMYYILCNPNLGFVIEKF